MTNQDTRYFDGWFRAADDRLERNEWTILKTHDGNGGPIYLLFYGRTGRGKSTECINVFKSARAAMDDVAYREARRDDFLSEGPIAEIGR